MQQYFLEDCVELTKFVAPPDTRKRKSTGKKANRTDDDDDDDEGRWWLCGRLLRNLKIEKLFIKIYELTYFLYLGAITIFFKYFVFGIHLAGLGEEEEDLNKTCQLGNNYSSQTVEAMSQLSEKDVCTTTFYNILKIFSNTKRNSLTGISAFL